MLKHLKHLTFLMALLATVALHAQKTKTQKQPKDKQEEVEKPPPPQEEIVDVRIDTTNAGMDEGTTTKEFSKEDLFFNFPDTTAAPSDELTKQIKNMLELTGALNIGVEYAKLMQTDDEKARNGLPKEFYQKMFAELTNGPYRDIFENALVKVYRKYYTLDEVNELIAFYKTDIGKKLLERIPALMKEGQEVGMSIGKVLGMKVYNDLLKEGKLN